MRTTTPRSCRLGDARSELYAWRLNRPKTAWRASLEYHSVRLSRGHRLPRGKAVGGMGRVPGVEEVCPVLLHCEAQRNLLVRIGELAAG